MATGGYGNAIDAIDWDDTVDLRIGKEGRRFTIHRDILRQNSPLFAQMLQGPVVEEKSEFFMGGQTLSKKEWNTKVQLNLGKLYSLADYLGDIAAKNAVTDLLVAKMQVGRSEEGELSVELARHVFDVWKLDDYADHVMHDLIVDWAVYFSNEDWFHKNRERVSGLGWIAAEHEMANEDSASRDEIAGGMAAEIALGKAYHDDRPRSGPLYEEAQRVEYAEYERRTAADEVARWMNGIPETV